MSYDSDIQQDILNSYIQGLENEYYLDQYAMRQDGIKSSFVIARYLSLRKCKQKYKFVFDIAIHFLSLFWPIIFKFLMWRKYKKYKLLLKETPEKFNFTNIALGTSSRIDQLLSKTDEEVDRVISIPRYDISIPNTSILEYLSLDDLNEAYKLVKFLKFSEIKNISGKRDAYLQAFDAFDCFVLAVFLRKMKMIRKIVFCNHYDRWALIIDRNTFSTLIQIQHGLLDENILIPTKLNSIKATYVFDNKSKYIFQRNYYGKLSEVVFKNIILTLELAPCKNRPALLFIGGPRDGEKENMLIRKIRNEFPKIYIYIKPHPKYQFSNYISLSNLERLFIIKDKAHFPEVDIVLSYYSTLAVEYDSMNIPVLYHDELPEENIFKNIIKILCKSGRTTLK